jgi:hypothetical protein
MPRRLNSPRVVVAALAGLLLLAAVPAIRRERARPVAPQPGTSATPSAGPSREVLADNLMRAAALRQRVRAVPLRTADGPAALFHGFLACGDKLQLYRSDGSGQPISWEAYLTDYAAPALDPPSQTPAAARGHPGQFLCYLFLGLPAARPAGHPPAIVQRLWRQQQDFCHGTLDVAWLVPAFACDQPTTSFVNKFAERVDATYLVHHLIQQSRWPLRTQVCGGMHSLYALGAARRFLLTALDENAAVELEAEWQSRLTLIRAAFRPDGEVEVADLVGERPERLDLTTELVLSGHLLEALAASRDDALLKERSFHRFVGHTIRRASAAAVWDHPGGLLAPAPGGHTLYAALAHLAHGLGEYEQAAREAWPGRADGPTASQPAVGADRADGL